MANHDFQTTLEKRLAKYGAMSLAAAAGVLATPAHASLLITDGSACPFTSTTGGALYFNGATQSCSATSAGAMFKIEKIVGGSGTINLRVVGMTSFAQVAGTGNFITKLASNAFSGFSNGSFLGGALEIRSSSGAHSGAWSNGDSGYVGLLSSPSGFHYGWAQVSISGYDASLIRFAYDDNAGPPPTSTPEPSSMALLALGSAGLLAYRRKRAKAV